MTNEKASQNKMLMTLKKEKIIFQKIIFKRVDKKNIISGMSQQFIFYIFSVIVFRGFKNFSA